MHKDHVKIEIENTEFPQIVVNHYPPDIKEASGIQTPLIPEANAKTISEELELQTQHSVDDETSPIVISEVCSYLPDDNFCYLLLVNITLPKFVSRFDYIC